MLKGGFLLMKFVFSSMVRVLFIRVFGWSVFVSSLKLIVGVPNVREGNGDRMVIRSEADYRVW